MKEEEAKEKWCPMVRIGNAIGGTSNRDEHGYHLQTSDNIKRTYNCIASDCMLWQWNTDTYIVSMEDRSKDQHTTSDTAGYCGLAK